MSTFTGSGQLVRSRTADRVYVYLRDAIASGSLSGGERVDLKDVARTLDVSRTPVREAVQRLEADGFLQGDPYRSSIVTTVDEAYVDEVIALRVHNEGLAARLGSSHLSADDIDEMDSLLTELNALDSPDHSEFARLNGEFHSVLYRATNAPRLLSMIERLNRHAERIRLHYQIARNNNVAEQHHEILMACANGDSDGVERCVRKHILGVLVEMERMSHLASPDQLRILQTVLDDDEWREFVAALRSARPDLQRTPAAPRDRGSLSLRGDGAGGRLSHATIQSGSTDSRG